MVLVEMGSGGMTEWEMIEQGKVGGGGKVGQ